MKQCNRVLNNARLNKTPRQANRLKLSALAVLMCSPLTFANDLQLKGVIDGPLPGGLPKAVKVYVGSDINDLSQCGLGSANNGGGSDGQEFTFPAVSALAGDYIYVASESESFAQYLGFSPNYTSSAANINGDDAIELFCGDEVIDVFGDINVDGTGEAWEYLDGWAHRVDGTEADGTFELSHWEFSGPNALDGAATNETSDSPFRTDVDIDDNGDDDDSDGDDGNDDNVDDNVEPTVIISEYVEGSSNEKAVELYNVTDTDIDLAAQGYVLKRFSNGGVSGTSISLSGTITANGTFVIVNSAASEELLSFANVTSGSLNHNGDDAYVLYLGDTVIDSFGRVGEDPGSEWGSGLTSTQNNTLVRKSEILTGDVIIDDEFNPAIEWQGYESDTFENLGWHIDGGNDDGGGDDLAIGNCGETATLISAIQGNDFSSPLLSETHIIEGVVTASFSAINGYFIQEEAADMDADSLTSEGIFVYSTELPSVGSVVRVVGEVGEYYNKTQLTANGSFVECGAAEFASTNLTLPFSSALAIEALEGMHVTTSSALTVNDTYNLGRYGEVGLAKDLRYIPTNVYAPGSPEAIALQAENDLNYVLLDDVNGTQNPEDIIYPTGGLSAINTLRLGDKVTTLSGVMDYSFSNYRVLPTQAPLFESVNLRTTEPTIVSGNIKVASLNVLNLFNGDGQGAGFPTARGADNIEEFDRQIVKTTEAILAIDADIIGLMEIENDGVDEYSTLADLVNRLNAEAGEGTYDFVNAGGAIGTDAIAVALLYKTATISLVGEAKTNGSDIFNRPPLAQIFSLTANNEELVVAVNHFKSKGCGSASDLNEDQADGQGCYNARRTDQANELINWINTEETLSTQENVLVIGDLNAYAKEDPITAFEVNGYSNLIEQFSGAKAYSYSYSGEVGYLDHALANTSLAEKAVDAVEWHINADEPRILDYNTEYKSDQQLIDLYAPDVYRVSDHDPVIVTFDLSAAMLIGDWDGDGDVDAWDMRGLITAIRRGQDIDSSFDINNDGVINFLDARAMISLCSNKYCGK